jgi:hypothetical protein
MGTSIAVHQQVSRRGLQMILRAAATNLDWPVDIGADLHPRAYAA